jgi:hypothetical protein
MKKMEDLRFIIGAFFGLLGIILLISSQIFIPNDPDLNLNLLSGGMMILFATVMISLAVTDRR